MSNREYIDQRSTPKEIARRVSMCGSYLNDSRTKLSRPPAKHVVNLPGAENLDIRQGVAEGMIGKGAAVWGIESDANVVDMIHQYGMVPEVNVIPCHTELQDYRPPRKIDMFVGDLMCRPSLWIGKFLSRHIVPNMKRRHSSISVNLYSQMVHSGRGDSNPDLFRDMYHDNSDEFLSPTAWDLTRPQRNVWAAFDLKQDRITPAPLARSIGVPSEITTGITNSPENNGCFLSFVSIHHFMKNTDFRYGGCYLYRQKPRGKNSGKMLTLYYYRG